MQPGNARVRERSSADLCELAALGYNLEQSAHPFSVAEQQMPLLWFHATTRSDPADYVRLLKQGLSPAPFVTRTQQLEFYLGILPHRVYCYLGRTLEAFGNFCVALVPESIPVSGHLSPFDTGGLVRKIKPVCEWENARKAEYLNAYTFETEHRVQCLAKYPSTELSKYLEGTRPLHSGPHELWEDKPYADVWAQGTHWRAWTWEGRWEQLPIAGHVFAWTCAPALFPEILEAAETLADVAPQTVAEFLSKYKPGGVGALVADMVREQAL